MKKFIFSLPPSGEHPISHSESTECSKRLSKSEYPHTVPHIQRLLCLIPHQTEHLRRHLKGTIAYVI
jgi:hypothetical protein